MIIGTDRVIGNGVGAANMYQALALPWVPQLLADQRLAGILALVIGELSLFLMMIALLARWHQLDGISGEAQPSPHYHYAGVAADRSSG
jgi:cytochrome c oxidase assembly factor CtaG